jgi:hypothetical protein
LARHSQTELSGREVRGIAKQQLLDRAERQAIMEQCVLHPLPFVGRFCQIYDSKASDWIPFELWPEQVKVLNQLHRHKLTIVLKARQLGLSWLALSYALWQMVFQPKAIVLLLSRRDDEAVDLLDARLRGMWERLPDWLKVPAVKRSAHELELSNGSRALAFPTTGGRSYTATLAIVDEADFCPDLEDVLLAVKPAIDAGGHMALVSTVDKTQPMSSFKNLYRAAKGSGSKWHPVFLPWNSRPDRDAKWYEEQKADIRTRTGSLDGLYQEYPETDTQALAPNELDKAIPAEWLEKCYQTDLEPVPGGPNIPGLQVFWGPEDGMKYVIGVDPAEGNPTSDDSAITVMLVEGQEEVASLAGRITPPVLASYVKELSEWYNHAPAMVERNNHGHAVLLELSNLGGVQRLRGWDKKPGWLTTSRGKALVYDTAIEAMRESTCVVRSFGTMTQLQSIEGGSLSAPVGLHDDRAMSYVLCLAALGKEVPDTIPGGPDPFRPLHHHNGRNNVTFGTDEEGKTIFVYEVDNQAHSLARLKFGR